MKIKEYSHRSVKRQGKIDGRGWKWKFWPFVKSASPVQPKTDQKISAQFEKELIEVAQNIASEISGLWHEKDTKMKPEYCAALSNSKAALESYQKESGDVERFLPEYEAAKKKYEEQTPPSLSHFWHMFWLIIIGVLEFPLNSIVFEILGQPKIETYLISFLMCITIPITAFFFGRALHQESKTITDKALMFIMPVIALGVIGVVSYSRSKYFEAMQITKVLGIEVTPTEATIGFIVINVAVFFLAVVVSYEGSHPQHRLYSYIRKRFDEAKKELAKEKAEAKKAAEILKRADEKLEEISARRERTFKRYLEEIHTVIERSKWLISTYRHNNLSVRDDMPECFKVEPEEIPVPEAMVALDWNCGEQKEKQ
jgi:hypothetical protein